MIVFLFLTVEVVAVTLGPPVGSERAAARATSSRCVPPTATIPPVGVSLVSCGENSWPACLRVGHVNECAVEHHWHRGTGLCRPSGRKDRHARRRQLPQIVIHPSGEEPHAVVEPRVEGGHCCCTSGLGIAAVRTFELRAVDRFDLRHGEAARRHVCRHSRKPPPGAAIGCGHVRRAHALAERDARLTARICIVGVDGVAFVGVAGRNASARLILAVHTRLHRGRHRHRLTCRPCCPARRRVKNTPASRVTHALEVAPSKDGRPRRAGVGVARVAQADIGVA
eukprot:1316045-Prymnesium_polylepis.3